MPLRRAYGRRRRTCLVYCNLDFHLYLNCFECSEREMMNSESRRERELIIILWSFRDGICLYVSTLVGIIARKNKGTVDGSSSTRLWRGFSERAPPPSRGEELIHKERKRHAPLNGKAANVHGYCKLEAARGASGPRPFPLPSSFGPLPRVLPPSPPETSFHTSLSYLVHVPDAQSRGGWEMCMV